MAVTTPMRSSCTSRSPCRARIRDRPPDCCRAQTIRLAQRDLKQVGDALATLDRAHDRSRSPPGRHHRHARTRIDYAKVPASRIERPGAQCSNRSARPCKTASPHQRARRIDHRASKPWAIVTGRPRSAVAQVALDALELLAQRLFGALRASASSSPSVSPERSRATRAGDRPTGSGSCARRDRAARGSPPAVRGSWCADARRWSTARRRDRLDLGWSSNRCARWRASRMPERGAATRRRTRFAPMTRTGARRAAADVLAEHREHRRGRHAPSAARPPGSGSRGRAFHQHGDRCRPIARECVRSDVRLDRSAIHTRTEYRESQLGRSA